LRFDNHIDVGEELAPEHVPQLGLRHDRPCPQKSYWSSAFKQADIVALVKVISGNTETYDIAVNKAEVLKNFKGAAAGETIYFGAKTVLCGNLYISKQPTSWFALVFSLHPQ
jgi:hypothetical protein